MKIILPSVEFIGDINGEKILRSIELAARTCYKSENKITGDSYKKLINMLITNGHLAMIEFGDITVKLICDRGVSHEIVRHRIASYAQESTRYCNYGKDKFGNELTFIKPCYWEENSEEYSLWKSSLDIIEKNYLSLLSMGVTPQEARAILPNSLKTELCIKMNLREWIHFLTLRTSAAAHPQMREVAELILDLFKNNIPIVFDNINTL